jgi:hypothetical protein
MNTQIIKKVILTIVVVALVLVPVTLVALLSINSKNADAYNPYFQDQLLNDKSCYTNGFNLTDNSSECFLDRSRAYCQNYFNKPGLYNEVGIAVRDGDNDLCVPGANIPINQPNCSKSNEYLINGRCQVRNKVTTPKYDNPPMDYGYFDNKTGYNEGFDIFGNRVGISDFEKPPTYNQDFIIDPKLNPSFDFDCEYGQRKEYYDLDNFTCVQDEINYGVSAYDMEGGFFGDPLRRDLPDEFFDADPGYFGV